MKDLKLIRGHEFVKHGSSFKIIVNERMEGYYSQNYKCQRCNQIIVDWAMNDKVSLCPNMKVQESAWKWFTNLFKEDDTFR